MTKDEERAAKFRPAGTKVLSDQERIRTLDELERNKKAVTTLLMQLPISMRTENLKQQKRELEAKLIEIEKAIETFSRRVVYVKMD